VDRTSQTARVQLQTGYRLLAERYECELETDAVLKTWNPFKATLSIRRPLPRQVEQTSTNE
jgi:hypothetical protein